MSMQKLAEIRSYLNGKFFERSEVIEALLCALVARQHLLLIAPAGTAKSALTSELSKIITGGNYFQWLLTKFSTPEELFGALSLSALEQDIYRRNITSKLPEAHIAFLDEIFKANSAILNSLLTILNERLFYNDNRPLPTPLSTLVGASNEYPEDGEGLEALFDRFLLRFELPYIQDDNNFISMLRGGGNATVPTMSLSELEHLQEHSEMVALPDDVLQTLATIRRKLRDEGIQASDRRFKQSLSLLRAKAMLEQRMDVKITDLVLLKNALWVSPDQKETVRQVVEEHAMDRIDRLIDTYEAELQELLSGLTSTTSPSESMEIAAKVRTLGQTIAALNQDPGVSNEQRPRILDLDNKVTSAMGQLGAMFLGRGVNVNA